MNFIRRSFQSLVTPPKNQIGALDGIRTFAIVLVVGLHAEIFFRQNGGGTTLLSGFPPFQGGWSGVLLFYVLSGFFIGSQLWKEFAKTGDIEVRQFILRRGMRIWPLYYTIFFVTLLLANKEYPYAWTNFFFVANYFGNHGPVSGAWSLATEEQFYILMPLLIVFAAKYCGVRTLVAFRKILLASLILPTVFRAVTYYFISNGFQTLDMLAVMDYIYKPFHTNCDGLLLGMLISNVTVDRDFRSRWLTAYAGWLVLVSAVLGFALRKIDFVIFTYLGLSMVFAAAVWWCLKRDNWVTRFLGHRFFFWTAKTSFGVYLLHQWISIAMLELDFVFWEGMSKEFQLVTLFIVNYFVSCLLCSLTYMFIELPFLELRNKWMEKKSRVKTLSEESISHDKAG